MVSAQNNAGTVSEFAFFFFGESPNPIVAANVSIGWLVNGDGVINAPIVDISHERQLQFYPDR